MRPAHRTHVATTVCGVVIIAVLTAFFMVPPGWRSRTVLVYNEFLGAYYVFGFDAGGHLDMSASVSNGLEVHMVVCRDDQFDRVARTGVDALCEDLNATATLCDFFATANPVHPAHFEGSMDSDLYFFAYLNCKSGTGTAAITIEAVNPGGEHLSTTLQPYKAGTVVFLAIMAFMAISWGATLLAHRQVCSAVSEPDNMLIHATCPHSYPPTRHPSGLLCSTTGFSPSRWPRRCG